MSIRGLTTKRMAAIFNEWNRRYAENPGEFSECLDDEGNPIQDYGLEAAQTFNRIADEMDAAGTLPRLQR